MSAARHRGPRIRIAAKNTAPLRADGDHVLHHMCAARRTSYSFGLDRAVERCREIDRPLLVLEALRAGYPFASDRLHAFILEGMAANARRFARARVTSHSCVEQAPGEGRGLFAALATRAGAVVADDSPAFFLPRILAAAAARCPVRCGAVDGNGILPLAVTPRVFPGACVFRRFLQGAAREALSDFPAADRLGRYDRPWGSERKVVGTIRHMSPKNTIRKVRLRRYLARYSPERLP